MGGSARAARHAAATGAMPSAAARHAAAGPRESHATSRIRQDNEAQAAAGAIHRLHALEPLFAP